MRVRRIGSRRTASAHTLWKRFKSILLSQQMNTLLDIGVGRDGCHRKKAFLERRAGIRIRYLADVDVTRGCCLLAKVTDVFFALEERRLEISSFVVAEW